jgi:hypothetical protein
MLTKLPSLVSLLNQTKLKENKELLSTTAHTPT